MTRMRVHELAKELNLNNKDLIDRILKLGIQVKNHMSTLTDSAVTKIRQQFSESRAEQVEEKRIGRALANFIVVLGSAFVVFAGTSLILFFE